MLLNTANHIYLGATAVDAVYLGMVRVWPAETLLFADAPYRFSGTSTSGASTHGNLVDYGHGMASFFDVNDVPIWTTYLLPHRGAQGRVVVRLGDGTIYQQWTGPYSGISNNRWQLWYRTSFIPAPPVGTGLLVTAYLL